MHSLDGIGNWNRPARRRDPVRHVVAAIATLLLYLPLLFALLLRPGLLVSPMAAPPKMVETMMRLLPRPHMRVQPEREFLTRLIRPAAMNAPAPHVVVAPALAPPALLPVTAADISLLAGGALPGNGAVSGTGTGGNGTGVSACIDPAYLAAITRHVGHFFRYPVEAARAGMMGVTYVRFVVDKNGYTSGLSVVTGSGERALDAYALALMREASPLPPIPARMHTDQMDSVLPIVFSLDGRARPGTHPSGAINGCS